MTTCQFCQLIHDPEISNCNDPLTGALIRRAGPIAKPKPTFHLCVNADCNRLVPDTADVCQHCQTNQTGRFSEGEIVVRVFGGKFAHSVLSSALQSIHPDNPQLTCVQFLEHARNSMDAADAELQGANKLASGMASLLLFDMIREVCVMAARIRAILAAAKDAEEKFHVYCEGDGSWLDVSKGVFSMDRGQATAMTRAEAAKHADGAIYHIVPVEQSPDDAVFERDWEKRHHTGTPPAALSGRRGKGGPGTEAS